MSECKCIYAFTQYYHLYDMKCWGNAYDMPIIRVLVLRRRIWQMFMLTSMTHCKSYAATAKILFINDMLNNQLYLIAYKIHHNYVACAS